MKRIVFAVSVMLLMLGSVAPVASAAVEPTVVIQGLGAGRALDLSIPALNVLPLSVTQGFKGLTVGLTSSNFSGLTSSKAAGLAIGHCQLLAAGLSLPTVGTLPCTQEAVESSASDGDQGDGQQKCASALTLAIVNLVTSCANSVSRLESSRPVSLNNAGVAEVNIGLDLNLLKSLGLPLDVASVKTQVVSTVEGLVKTVLGTVPSLPALSPAQTSQLTDAITNLLNQIIAGAGKLATVKAGLSSTDVTNASQITTVLAQAAGAKIGLLGLTDALKDGLVIVEVGAARAVASWNDVTAQAEASATPAVATLKVKDLLGLTNSPDGYITANVEAPALQNVLSVLNGTPLETTIELASGTPKQVGSRVSATTTGVGIHALKGLGASSVGAKDGGLVLRLAAANVSVSGDVVKAEVVQAPLPVTGGPTYAFLAGAAILAAGAPLLLRIAHRIRKSG